MFVQVVRATSIHFPYPRGIVIRTNDGGYIIAQANDSSDYPGHIPGNSTPDSICPGKLNNNYWVVKYDSFGAIQWEHSYGGSCNDFPYSIIQTSDGGYIVAGTTLSDDGDVKGNYWYLDYWIVKLSSTGSIEWDSNYGGTLWDKAYSIKQTMDGGYIIAGYSNSGYDDVNGDHVGSHDYWIVKISPTGVIQWESCYGGGATDEAYDIQQCYDGGYIIVGETNSSDDDVTGHHAGDTATYDYWVVKLTPFPPIITSSQLQPFTALFCGTQAFDTMTVHNTGYGPLVIGSAAFGAGGQDFTLLAPASFPVTVKPLDSVQLIVTFAPHAAGMKSSILSLTSNDSLQNPWNITFTGMKDSIGYDVQGIANDTLDFGAVACGVPADTSFTLASSSTLASLFTVQHWNAAYFTLSPASAYLNSGGTKTIAVHFTGSTAAGGYADSVIIADTACTMTKTIFIKARVEPIMVTLNAPSDTALCTGDSLRLTAPAGFAAYQWSTGATAQSIVVTAPGTYFVEASSTGDCEGRSDR